MAVREIAASFEHECDGCKVIVSRSSASRPPHWTGLHILADAYDYQGTAVAETSVKRTLCAECSQIVHEAVNEAIAELRAALSPLQEQGETQ